MQQKNRRWQQKAPYVLLFIALGWSLFFAGKWADGQLISYASQTSALLYDLSSDLQNLPQPNFIEPGKTSGNAAGIVSKYEKATKDLREASRRLSPPALPRLLLSWKIGKLTRTSSEAKKTLNWAADELEITTGALKAARKFIEYAPASDLKNIGDPNSDSAERLERTKTGLQKTANDLDGTAYPQGPQMAQLISPLVEQAPNLTDGTVAAWTDQVSKAQAGLVSTFQGSWNLYIKNQGVSLHRLASDVATNYQ